MVEKRFEMETKATYKIEIAKSQEIVLQIVGAATAKLQVPTNYCHCTGRCPCPRDQLCLLVMFHWRIVS